MASLRHFHQARKFWFVMQGREQRVGDEIWIGKKTVLDTVPQNSSSRRAISENGIGFCNFINRLSIAHAPFLNFVFGLMQDLQTFRRLICDRIA